MILLGWRDIDIMVAVIELDMPTKRPSDQWRPANTGHMCVAPPATKLNTERLLNIRNEQINLFIFIDGVNITAN